MLRNTPGESLKSTQNGARATGDQRTYGVGQPRSKCSSIPGRLGEYNESMNCQVKDELVSRLVALNNKLNLLSPDLVHGDEERAEVQQQRENLYSEIKHHRAKGHEGKPCPAAKQVWASHL